MNGESKPKIHALDWPANAGVVADVLREMKGEVRHLRRRRLQAVVGAAAALAALGFVWRLVPRTSPPPAPTANLASGPFLSSRQVLEDGSVVELKAGARISVAYSKGLRRITLVQGQALFQVAKNKNRPFVVAVRGIEVRAVGTAFAVDMDDKEVDVFVTEGRVAVDRPGKPAGPAADVDDAGPTPIAPPLASSRTLALVDAWNRISVDTSSLQPTLSPIRSVSSAESDRLLAWRAPRLEFSGTTLEDAIPLINEHSQVRIILGDPALAKLRISGILRADNVETLLDVLKSNYGIRAERHGDAEIILWGTR